MIANPGLNVPQWIPHEPNQSNPTAWPQVFLPLSKSGSQFPPAGSERTKAGQVTGPNQSNPSTNQKRREMKRRSKQFGF